MQRTTRLIGAAALWLLLSVHLHSAHRIEMVRPSGEIAAFVPVPKTDPEQAKPKPRPGSFDSRTGKARELLLKERGGTKESEKAVADGLHWLVKIQHAEGKWQLDGKFPDPGVANDVAGTAFGLLPILAAGKTHKADKNNPFDKSVEKALVFLIRQQRKDTGEFGEGAYSHALATIAVCEAYGMTKDPQLKQPAQLAAKFIVDAQHVWGGWRYGPGQPGDTSVTGFQIMALVAAKHSGLDVPDATWRAARNYLESACDANDEGYGYAARGSTPPMSAVGLLCRQHLADWSPKNPRLLKGIDNHLKTTPPGKTKNMYYYYYATQVMFHAGGDAWKAWNEKMRDGLIASQVKAGDLAGSWSSAGDQWSGAGGRLMQTSLSLLTLEVYYRHVPLFPAGDGK